MVTSSYLGGFPTSTMVHTRSVSGSANGSMPVRCMTRNPGQSSSTLNSPTRPKNSCMLTRDSSPTCFFMTIVYTPYRIALNAAIASPSAISAGVLCGKVPWLPPSPPSAGGLSDDVDDRSTREIRIMPAREARTPRSLRRVNFSTPMKAPNMSVQTPIYVPYQSSFSNLMFLAL